MDTFNLMFNEPPALVFIQEQGKRYPTVYQDGKEVKGIRSIVIRARVDDLTTHEIEYVTGRTRDEAMG